MDFYRWVGRYPVKVKKEVVGHIANRLTAALYREVVHLVAEGIGTVEDVDAVITQGPGLRWALMGPNLVYHLAGGAAECVAPADCSIIADCRGGHFV